MTLKDRMAQDIFSVFLRTTDFCDELHIQSGTKAVTIIGSLQQNTIENNADHKAPLQSTSWTLYTKYPLDGGFEWSAGMRAIINGEAYSVVDVGDELGIATIHLTKGGAR
jgi:hypothetical protein